MLTNTVLLFTRELLPVLLILVLLMQWLQPGGRRLLGVSALLTGFALLLVVPGLAKITGMAGGNGLELLFGICHFIALLSLFLLHSRRLRMAAAVIAFSATAVICAVNLLLYSLTSLASTPIPEPFLLGTILALGIGLSISVLWYQVLAELKRYTHWGLPVMTALPASRECVELITLIQQTAWLESGESVWNSGALIAEQTEAGVFLHAWFGYEATPTLIQLVGWLTVLLLMLAPAFRKRITP